MDINRYCVPQHAKRGGHGASKKKIGSRGTDKLCFIVCSFLPCLGDWVTGSIYVLMLFYPLVNREFISPLRNFLL